MHEIDPREQALKLLADSDSFVVVSVKNGYVGITTGGQDIAGLVFGIESVKQQILSRVSFKPRPETVLPPASINDQPEVSSEPES